MVPSSDAQTGEKVVSNTKRERLPAERGVERSDEANNWEGEENYRVKPIDLVQAVGPGNRRERLRVLESVIDIVVGDVHVDWSLHGWLWRLSSPSIVLYRACDLTLGKNFRGVVSRGPWREQPRAGSLAEALRVLGEKDT